MPFNRTGTMRAIHALGSKNGYSHDDLRDLATSLFGITREKISLGKLTDSQLISLCESLRGNQPKGPVPVSNKASKRQLWKIKAQASELGWTSTPSRLEGFLHRQCKKSELADLTVVDAIKVIDGLKNLIERGISDPQ